MKEKSIIFERISQILEYYDIKNVSVFAKKYLGYDSPEKINRLKDNNKRPSYEILEDISKKFEEVSIDWLITGRGEMIKKTSKNELNSDQKITLSCDVLEVLNNTIKEKDRQINDLIAIISQISK